MKPRGSGGQGSNGNSTGQWEQWPDEGAAASSGHANEDDDLQRAIAASLADPEQGTCTRHLYVEHDTLVGVVTAFLQNPASNVMLHSFLPDQVLLVTIVYQSGSVMHASHQQCACHRLLHGYAAFCELLLLKPVYDCSHDRS